MEVCPWGVLTLLWQVTAEFNREPIDTVWVRVLQPKSDFQELSQCLLTSGSLGKWQTQILWTWQALCAFYGLPNLFFPFALSHFPLLSCPVPFTFPVFHAFYCYWALLHAPPSLGFCLLVLPTTLPLCCLASFLNLFTLMPLRASCATGHRKLCITQRTVSPNLY